MNRKWVYEDALYDEHDDFGGSQWSLPSPDALWDSLHRARENAPTYRRKKDKLQSHLPEPLPLRVAFRKKEPRSNSESTESSPVVKKRVPKPVDKLERNSESSPILNTPISNTISGSSSKSEPTATTATTVAAATVPYPFPLYQAGGQWGPVCHPHYPIHPGFPLGMMQSPSFVQQPPMPTILPMVVYSAPMTNHMGMPVVGSGSVVMGGMGSGPVAMGGAGGPVTMGGAGGPVAMGGMGSGPVAMGGAGGPLVLSGNDTGGMVAPSQTLFNGSISGPGLMNPGAVHGMVQTQGQYTGGHPYVGISPNCKWSNQTGFQGNQSLIHSNAQVHCRQFSNEIFRDLLQDVVKEEVPRLLTDLREEMMSCAGWFLTDPEYKAACGVVEDLVSEVVYQSASGVVGEAIDELHKAKVTSSKKAVSDSILFASAVTMDQIIDELVRSEAGEVLRGVHSLEPVMEWAEQYAREVVEDCHRQEVHAERAERQKKVGSVVSDYIVEPVLFEEALSQALVSQGGGLLRSDRLPDCILDEVLLSCILSLSLDQSSRHQSDM